MNQTIWIISEIYYPDESGTGYYVTRLAEEFTSNYHVNVLCGHPIYDARGSIVPSKEIRNNVHIERCFGTTLNKNVILYRLINLVTISISFFIRGLFRIRRGDYVLVVTNPPALPFLIALICWMKGAKCILKIDDVYPEILVAAGITHANNIGIKIFSSLTKHLYQSVDSMVVLGRDMKALVEQKLNHTTSRLSIIPNWADVDVITPESKLNNTLTHELGITHKFIVQYAGNMGRLQGIENLFSAIKLLQDQKEDSIHFLFIGDGAKKQWMQSEILKNSLENVTLLEQLPRSKQSVFLNASDCNIVSLVSDMVGAGVPSRTYNIMAAGKPIIAIVDSNSEVAMVVAEDDIGWVVPPNRPKHLAKLILDIKNKPDVLVMMGIRARLVAEKKYSPDSVVTKYLELFKKED